MIKLRVNTHYHNPLDLHNISHQHLVPRSSAQCRIPARLAGDAVGEPGLGKKTPPLREPGSQFACRAAQGEMEKLRLGFTPSRSATIRMMRMMRTQDTGC